MVTGWSGRRTTGLLQSGQPWLWSRARNKHARQNVWPHGVVIGSWKSFRHRTHSNSSVIAWMKEEEEPSTRKDDQEHNPRPLWVQLHTFRDGYLVAALVSVVLGSQRVTSASRVHCWYVVTIASPLVLKVTPHIFFLLVSSRFSYMAVSLYGFAFLF